MGRHAHTTYTYTMQLSRHTATGWSGGGGGSSTRGRTDSDGAEQRPPRRPLLCLPERAVCLRSSSAVRCREAWRRGEARRGGGGGGGSGTRGRTDSDWAEQRPPGRPLLCLPERAVCAQLERGQVHREAWRRGETRRLERGQVHREAWRRGETRRRWRAGERPARGEAGDGPESDRAQRSEASRSSLGRC